ncbi:MAG: alpha-hydroxy-acid oxidizing protein, partial [Stellaceae bacterium]
AGVAHAIGLLKSEIDTTMALCGVTRIADLNPSLLRRPG